MEPLAKEIHGRSCGGVAIGRRLRLGHLPPLGADRARLVRCACRAWRRLALGRVVSGDRRRDDRGQHGKRHEQARDKRQPHATNRTAVAVGSEDRPDAGFDPLRAPHREGDAGSLRPGRQPGRHGKEVFGVVVGMRAGAEHAIVAGGLLLGPQTPKAPPRQRMEPEQPAGEFADELRGDVAPPDVR